MKRLIAISLLLVLFLCSCSRLEHTDITPAESKTELTHKSYGILYIANTSTKTYHLSSCYVLKRISEDKKFETYDKDFLDRREFSPCKICKPN